MDVIDLSVRKHRDNRSWWYAEAWSGQADPAPQPLTGDGEADVAIVGAGFVGLWTALCVHDRDPSQRIVVLDAGMAGSGASGMNGGKCHGYWGSLPGLVTTLGPDGALALCRAASQAQDAIRAFAARSEIDVWWREAGHAKVATTPAQEDKLAAIVAAAEALGVAEEAREIGGRSIRAICATPRFRKAVFFREGANLQPARLALALRAEALRRGIRIAEATPVHRIRPGSPNLVEHAGGALRSREVVLAAGTALAALPAVAPHVSLFSSFVVITEPAPERLAEARWTNAVGLSDLRMFIHYFRTTPDGRVAMGSGSGPISFGAYDGAEKLFSDAASLERARAGLRTLVPAMADVAIAGEWGGPLDVSADRVPMIRSLTPHRVHVASGFSGHGVNPSHVAGQCLASLVLDQHDAWRALPLCTRTVPVLPREPIRFLGANVVRWGILSSEEADAADAQPPWLASAAAALPQMLGMSIGTR